MLTRAQKEGQIKESADEIKKSESLLFADFSRVSIAEMQNLRNALKKSGSKLRVLKKRLLKISLKNIGVNYDPTQFTAQTAVIFTPDVLAIASAVHKFSQSMEKLQKNFVVLGGYNLKENKEITADIFAILAKLPSREILLAQLAIVFSMPIKRLVHVLNSRKEQLSTANA